MVSVVVEKLAAKREQAQERWQQKRNADIYITVGMGTCGLAAGAANTITAID